MAEFAKCHLRRFSFCVGKGLEGAKVKKGAIAVLQVNDSGGPYNARLVAFDIKCIDS